MILDPEMSRLYSGAGCLHGKTGSVAELKIHSQEMAFEKLATASHCVRKRTCTSLSSCEPRLPQFRALVEREVT